MTQPVENHGLQGCPTINIDCYGRSWIQDLTVYVNGYNWRFLFDTTKKKGENFTSALYLDRGLFEYGSLYRYPVSKRYVVLVESPNEAQFQLVNFWGSRVAAILTHDREILEHHANSYRLDYGTAFVNSGNHVENCRKTELISFMGSIAHPSQFGYALRKSVVEMLQARGIPCYGRGIKTIDHKESALVPYGFSIAMENTQKDYYYTEKIIDCFLSETVPIYWGCPSIGEIFDLRGMICFNSIEELEQILKELDWDRYRVMLPYVLENSMVVKRNLLADYKDFYTRVAMFLVKQNSILHSVPMWKRTKFSAGLRYILSGLKKPV